MGILFNSSGRLKNFLKNNSIARDYFLMFSAILITIVSLSIWLSFSVYHSKERIKQEILVKQTNRIDRELSNDFDYIATFLIIIGQEISESGPDDLKKIANILKTPLMINQSINEKFSWAMFDWSDINNKMLVSTAFGIVDKPKDMSHRNYTKSAKNNPWKLQFDSVDIGASSDELVIPAGMGVTDKNNNFIGTVSLGFKILKLVHNIELALSSQYISFIILDERNKAVLSSADINEKSQSQCISEHFLYDNLVNKAEVASNVVKCGGVYYSYYKKLSKYPFVILAGYKESVADAEYNQILFPAVIGFLVIGFVSLLILLLMRNFFVKPIVQLSKIAERIIHYVPNQKIVIPSTRIKELDILGHQLNNLSHFVVKLKEIERELRVSKSEVERKVQERTIDLEKALSAKTEFLNNISHEIRTPVHGFTSVSEGLVEQWNFLNEEKKIRYIQDIANNAKRLGSLVGNLLDMSKFTSGKMVMDFKQIDLNKEIKNIIEECNILYLVHKNIHMNYHDNGEILLIADQERIAQVLRNLFFNAIKFTPDGGSINAVIEVYNDNIVHFSLTDTGIGIPEGEVQEIFEPFMQSSRTKNKSGGTGLGLGICKKIVEAHDGKIWAVSNLKGSTFNFTLPVVQHNGVKIIDNKSLIAANKIKVMMIDDDQSCLMSAEMQLAGDRFLFKDVLGGREGLAYLKTYPSVDIILLDLMISDLYGLNLLMEIKKDPKLAHIPVILQSGTSDESEIERAYELGISSFLKKPYSKADLIAEINKVLT